MKYEIYTTFHLEKCRYSNTDINWYIKDIKDSKYVKMEKYSKDIKDSKYTRDSKCINNINDGYKLSEH